MRFVLEDIKAEWLIDNLLPGQDDFFARHYRPGGERFNDDEARRWALGKLLGGIDIKNIAPGSGGGNTFVKTEALLGADTLRALLELEFETNGKVFVFDGMSAEAESYVYYGSETTDRWIEISFKEKS